MRTIKLIKISLFILIALTTGNLSNAQSEKKDQQPKTTVTIKDLIESRNFVFVPRYVSPLKGGTRYLTSRYDLQISRDSLVSYLPYFGRAYTAPLNSSDIGLNFTTTEFDYTATPHKNKGWDVKIKPKGNANINELSLRIFDNASATLNVTATNRDAISYQGYVTARNSEK